MTEPTIAFATPAEWEAWLAEHLPHGDEPPKVLGGPEWINQFRLAVP